MKHTYQSAPLKDDLTDTFKSKRVCKRCGLEKLISYKGIEVLFRSGQFYNHLPECIDWSVENAKTID